MPQLRPSTLASLLLGLQLGLCSAAALAQTCPSEYSSCDNGGCCLSSEQCCPKLEDGCCNSSTPYCCGDGTCAATPSGCSPASMAECDGYDVPCGGGCAPAGSDCCDLLGHYCPPESMCTSDTTCVLGSDPTLARQTVPLSTPETDPARRQVSPPFSNPGDATERSCSMTTPGSDAAVPSLALAAGAVLLLRRRLLRGLRGSSRLNRAGRR